MALEKSVQARRKAQQLAREGRIQQAIDEMRKLLSDGEVDPYDHVYLGDLLVRVGQLSDAIDSWLLAVRHYEQAGLNRNAIAICKKILRLDPRRHTVHRVLGDLYVLDGLWGEAVPHFLVYLDSVNGDDCFGPTFLETLEKAVSVVGLQVEAALRLADHYTRARRGDRAAELLTGLAAQLAQSGAGPELAEELRSRAREAWASHARQEGREAAADEGEAEARPVSHGLDEQLCADLEARGTDPWPSGPPPAALEERPETDGRGEARSGPFPAEEASPPAPARAAEEAAPSPDPIPDAPAIGREFVVEHLGAHAIPDPDRRGLAGATAAEPTREVPTPAPDEPLGREAEAIGQEAEAEGEVEADRIWDLDDGAGPALLEWPDEAEAAPVLDEPAATPETRPLPVPPGGPDEESSPTVGLLARAEAAFRSRDWPEAQRLFERALVEHPLEPQSLGRLVEVARALGDAGAEIRYLILLGDAWIEAGEMEKALAAFLEVHRIEPENGTARRRIARFREMGIPGADAVTPPAGLSVLSVLETGDARVIVEDPPKAAAGRDWLELAPLLEAFQEGLKNQIAGDDYQSHYDLAVSHRTMGLLDEAIDEADQALQCPGLPAEVECLARELKGLCLSELERHREAVHEFRAALDHATEDADRRRSLRYRLGVALESVGEWQEAAETFEAILCEAPAYLDAAARRDFCLREWVARDGEERAA